MAPGRHNLVAEAELPRAIAAAEAAGLRYQVLDEHLKVQPDLLSISTMHLAKGLEFRAVAVMACDDEVIPVMACIRVHLFASCRPYDISPLQGFKRAKPTSPYLATPSTQAQAFPTPLTQR